MRKGRDGEKKWKKWKMENNGENSGPLMSLPVDRLTLTDCIAAARANNLEHTVDYAAETSNTEK